MTATPVIIQGFISKKQTASAQGGRAYQQYYSIRFFGLKIGLLRYAPESNNEWDRLCGLLFYGEDAQGCDESPAGWIGDRTAVDYAFSGDPMDGPKICLKVYRRAAVRGGILLQDPNCVVDYPLPPVDGEWDHELRANGPLRRMAGRWILQRAERHPAGRGRIERHRLR